MKKPFASAPQLGTHLASLNLFREADGKVYITVASATGAISELDEKGKRGVTLPIDYVNRLIVEASANLPCVDKTFKQAWARFEAQGYRYNGDALENVRFGWEIAKGIAKP